MQVPVHPLLALVECHATGLKSLLTHYIDATVDSQFASLRNSIETMIQSGVIGPNCDGTHFGMTLPPQTHTNTDQSSDECSHEYSNGQLTNTQEHQNNLQNLVPLSNTFNTESMIKQEFDDDDEEDGKEIDDVAKYEKCVKGICTSFRENYDDTSGDDAETGKNGDESYDTTQLNVHNTLENTQLIISNEISPSPSLTNPINTESLIKQECLQDSSITSIPLDSNRNIALNYISVDEPIFGQNTQIQTDENDHNDDYYYDYDDACEDEYLNKTYCENEVCNLDHANNHNNHLDGYLTERDGDETDHVAKHDEAQFQIDISVTNNTQMNIQNDVLNNEQLAPSTNGVRSSACKYVQAKVLGDLAQSNVNPHKSGKRKSNQANKSVKKAKRKQILDDNEDTDSCDQEDNANNAIGEESIATVCNLQCSHCLKSFDFNSKFKQHLLVHTGERPFQCDLCDKRFKEKEKLARHQLIHQNMKRFGCKECSKRFTLKQHLDSHLLIHSGERPFACRHCDKSFTQSITRKRHEQAIHLHVKPYRCKQCGYTATHRSTIITHIRVIHFGLPKTIKDQRTLNIIDDRDPKKLVEKV